MRLNYSPSGSRCFKLPALMKLTRHPKQ